MKYNKIQLMIYGNGLDNVSAEFNSQKIKVLKVNKIKNPDYAFIDLQLDEELKPGTYELTLTKNGEKFSSTYDILERSNSIGKYAGFNSSDIIYLITPDRFSDADTSNDNIAGTLETHPNNSPNGRHGGDIQGIINHLDYFNELGVTALWINPLIENNTKISYHGYAATDLYKIDSRYGTNKLYKKLVDEAHKKGLKIILDHVGNHISLYHTWIKDIPTPDWINGTPADHFNSPYYKRQYFDPHSDSTMKDITTRGWFVDEMPDLNQDNPFVANYIIQNTIWWIESTGLDGVREDTYPYLNQNFASQWAKTLRDEYPGINIVGEVWNEESALVAPYQSGSYFPKIFDSNLPSVTDFGLFHATTNVFEKNKNISEVFETLEKDFLFPDINNLLIFLDNHDTHRIMFQVNGNKDRLKLALTLLLTMRGIPQLYYGTEIGLIGGNDHGQIRQNFPGGFPDDDSNAFDMQGRTKDQNEIFQLTKKLIELRKNFKSLSNGKLIQLSPLNNTYAYFRIMDDEKIMVLLNNKKESQKINFNKLSDYFTSVNKVRNLITGELLYISSDKDFVINGNSALVIQLLND